jgi:hypothetical protein
MEKITKGQLEAKISGAIIKFEKNLWVGVQWKPIASL